MNPKPFKVDQNIQRSSSSACIDGSSWFVAAGVVSLCPPCNPQNPKPMMQLPGSCSILQAFITSGIPAALQPCKTLQVMTAWSQGVTGKWN